MKLVKGVFAGAPHHLRGHHSSFENDVLTNEQDEEQEHADRMLQLLAGSLARRRAVRGAIQARMWEQHGWRQEEIAKLLGVSKATLYRWNRVLDEVIEQSLDDQRAPRRD